MKHEMNPVVHSFGHAVLTLLYISAIGWFMSHTQDIFANVEEPNFLIPVSMLLLFVLSATITGTLVLGRPILLYLDGKKRQALEFFGYTVAWLSVVTVFAFVALSMSA